MNAAVYATYTRRDKKIIPVERVSRGGTDIELVVRQSPRDSRRLRTSEPCLPVEQELAEEGRIVKYAETAGGENHFFFFLLRIFPTTYLTSIRVRPSCKTFSAFAPGSGETGIIGYTVENHFE